MASFVHLSLTREDAELLSIALKQHREELERDVREVHGREPSGIVKGWMDQLERMKLQIDERLKLIKESASEAEKEG